MSSPYQSLQHAEAIARYDLLTLEEYDVRLDLASDESTFGSVTTIRFRSTGGPTFVDLKPTRVNSIRFNGRALDPDLLERGRLPLDTVAGENELVVDAVMRFRNDGEGLHRSVDPADDKHYVYAMTFMDAAPTIFGCFDQPDLKAPYTMRITAPEDWKVLGNGRARRQHRARGSCADPTPLDLLRHPGRRPLRLDHRRARRHRTRFALPAVLRAHLDKDADELFEVTAQAFDEFHRLFGIRYPFGDYHQVFCRSSTPARWRTPAA